MRPSSDLGEERRLHEKLMKHQQEGDKIGMMSDYTTLGGRYQEQEELEKAEGIVSAGDGGDFMDSKYACSPPE